MRWTSLIICVQQRLPQMESFISITQNENNIRPFYIHYLQLWDYNILNIHSIEIQSKNPSIQVTSGRNQSLNSERCALYNQRIIRYRTSWILPLSHRHSSHNREFHNVNCRFCGAIHDVDRANISVLLQVIRNVNERKTV